MQIGKGLAKEERLQMSNKSMICEGPKVVSIDTSIRIVKRLRLWLWMGNLNIVLRLLLVLAVLDRRLIMMKNAISTKQKKKNYATKLKRKNYTTKISEEKSYYRDFNQINKNHCRNFNQRPEL